MAPDFLAWADALVEPTDAARRPHLTWRKLWAEVARVIRHAPDVVSARAVGESVEGEPLWAITVAHPRAVGPPVLVVAGLHALEHIGPVTAMRLIQRAAGGAHGSWATRRLVVVPVANPDGWRAVEGSLAAGKPPLRRANANGVDLNRNFAVGWREKPLLARLLPRVFAPGDAPLSEPETRALDAIAEEERPRVFASLHAFGEWIYLPYAGRREPPADLAAHEDAARRMCAKMAFPYRVMPLARRSRLFSAPGAEIDHMHDRHGALSFLLELGPGPRLGDPRSWLDVYRWYTPPPEELDAEVANVLPALDVLGELT